MIRINLLPHRELKRKQQQKNFFIMLGVVVGIGAAIALATHTYFSGSLDEQNGRNAYLDSEIAKLDSEISEIKKLKEQTAALLQRKNVVEALQANRGETVYLLDQLVRQLPDGVYLTSIAQKGTSVAITGYAQSNARVSTFMRNLESSPHLEKPNLVEIKASTDKNMQNARVSEFSLVVSLIRSKEDSGDAKKPPAAGAKAAVSLLQDTDVARMLAFNTLQARRERHS